MTEAELTIGGRSPVPLRMHRQTARRLAESAAITGAYADDRLYVLNHDQGGPKPGDRVTEFDRQSLDPVRSFTYQDE